MRALVQLKPLTLIKILRPLLPGQRLQQHLTDCAAYEVLSRARAPWLPPLGKRHIVGLARLPSRTAAKVLVFPRP